MLNKVYLIDKRPSNPVNKIDISMLPLSVLDSKYQYKDYVIEVI